ncbi:MAG: hypothetical protein QCI82_05295 [Candidatus Thermoplasmatota archaeon]|nr:hypothetical protein [Candidatus Thermoplasmatota archaeon]
MLGKENGSRIRFFGTRINLILAVLALIILIGSFSALVYNAMSTEETDVLIVNDKEYDWGSLERDLPMIEHEGRTGISLVALLEDAGVKDVGSRSFRFIGADGYRKEVPGEDIGNGFIVIEEKKVVLPGMAKAFWVRDIVEIEVI